VAHERNGGLRAFSVCRWRPALGLRTPRQGYPSATAKARAALPKTVPFVDAVHNLGALAAPPRGSAQGGP